MVLFKIVTRKACDTRTYFEKVLSNCEAKTQYYYIDKITLIDTALAQICTGDYSDLLCWYTNEVNIQSILN